MEVDGGELRVGLLAGDRWPAAPGSWRGNGTGRTASRWCRCSGSGAAPRNRSRSAIAASPPQPITLSDRGLAPSTDHAQRSRPRHHQAPGEHGGGSRGLNVSTETTPPARHVLTTLNFRTPRSRRGGVELGGHRDPSAPHPPRSLGGVPNLGLPDRTALNPHARTCCRRGPAIPRRPSPIRTQPTPGPRSLSGHQPVALLDRRLSIKRPAWWCTRTPRPAPNLPTIAKVAR